MKNWEAEGTEEQQERSVLNCEREAKRARAKRTEGEAQAEPERSGATGSEAACESCAVLKVREKRRRRASAEESKEENSQTISGDTSLREPPVPIPNTEVKPQHAEGTWLETAREIRSSPDSKRPMEAKWKV